jgi:glyoxylase-like metal-dependent hydrolase (beta-lactamase superfamily II)
MNFRTDVDPFGGPPLRLSVEGLTIGRSTNKILLIPGKEGIMLVQSFFVSGLSHISYIMAGSKTCAVIDPRRDIQIYLDAAKAMGVKITHILETHLHADFISGHMDLAEKTGAKIYAPKTGKCQFEHVALSEEISST